MCPVFMTTPEKLILFEAKAPPQKTENRKALVFTILPMNSNHKGGNGEEQRSLEANLADTFTAATALPATASEETKETKENAMTSAFMNFIGAGVTSVSQGDGFTMQSVKATSPGPIHSQLRQLNAEILESHKPRGEYVQNAALQVIDLLSLLAAVVEDGKDVSTKQSPTTTKQSPTTTKQSSTATEFTQSNQSSTATNQSSTATNQSSTATEFTQSKVTIEEIYNLLKQVKALLIRRMYNRGKLTLADLRLLKIIIVASDPGGVRTQGADGRVFDSSHARWYMVDEIVAATGCDANDAISFLNSVVQLDVLKDKPSAKISDVPKKRKDAEECCNEMLQEVLAEKREAGRKVCVFGRGLWFNHLLQLLFCTKYFANFKPPSHVHCARGIGNTITCSSDVDTGGCIFRVVFFYKKNIVAKFICGSRLHPAAKKRSASEAQVHIAAQHIADVVHGNVQRDTIYVEVKPVGDTFVVCNTATLTVPSFLTATATTTTSAETPQSSLSTTTTTPATTLSSSFSSPPLSEDKNVLQTSTEGSQEVAYRDKAKERILPLISTIIDLLKAQNCNDELRADAFDLTRPIAIQFLLECGVLSMPGFDELKTIFPNLYAVASDDWSASSSDDEIYDSRASHKLDNRTMTATGVSRSEGESLNSMITCRNVVKANQPISPQSLMEGGEILMEDMLGRAILANKNQNMLSVMFFGKFGNAFLQLDLEWWRLEYYFSTNIENYQDSNKLKGLLHCKLKARKNTLVTSPKVAVEASKGTFRGDVEFRVEGDTDPCAVCFVTSQLHPQADRTAASYAMRYINAQVLRDAILQDDMMYRMKTIVVKCVRDKDGNVSIWSPP